MITDKCWLWARSTSAGYGVLGYSIKENGRWKSILSRAHVVMYEMKYGRVPLGLELDHLCKNKLCMNPDHLEPVTHRENMLRAQAGKHNHDKTHCPKGHEYSGDNLIINNLGWRFCKECKADYQRRYRKSRRLQYA